jgi:hypothetical protein
MTTVGSSRIGLAGIAGMSTALALLFLGLGIAFSPDPAAAKDRPGAEAGNAAKAKSGGTREFVGKSYDDSNSRAVVKVKFNSKGVPVQIKSLRLSGADSACLLDPVRRKGVTIDANLNYQGRIKVGTGSAEGEKLRTVDVEIESGGDSIDVAGFFSSGFKDLRLAFAWEFVVDGAQVGSTEPQVDCSMGLIFDTALKAPQQKG